jgi:hypothetical protein
MPSPSDWIMLPVDLPVVRHVALYLTAVHCLVHSLHLIAWTSAKSLRKKQFNLFQLFHPRARDFSVLLFSRKTLGPIQLVAAVLPWFLLPGKGNEVGKLTIGLPLEPLLRICRAIPPSLYVLWHGVQLSQHTNVASSPFARSVYTRSSLAD